ncbi:MAG: LicD family protein, partial [Synergistaceae bacterium]|nr:LicD family protein [Synergistaceae bacterium]
MTDESLSLTRKIQLKELEIIKVFQDICRRHGLRFFAIGGTCLGAVRHKGFIPWDDDVDFTMPYEDYLKFAEIAKTELPPNYELYGNHSPRLFSNAYALRIHDRNTAFIDRKMLGIRDLAIGIHIDLLIANGLPPEPERKKVVILSLLYERLNKLMRLSNVARNFWRTIAKRIINILLAPVKLFLPYDYFITKMENLLGKYPIDCSDKIIFPWTNGGVYRKGLYRNVFSYEDFSDSIELPFEDTMLTVPVGY